MPEPILKSNLLLCFLQSFFAPRAQSAERNRPALCFHAGGTSYSPSICHRLVTMPILIVVRPVVPAIAMMAVNNHPRRRRVIDRCRIIHRRRHHNRGRHDYPRRGSANRRRHVHRWRRIPRTYADAERNAGLRTRRKGRGTHCNCKEEEFFHTDLSTWRYGPSSYPLKRT